MQAHAVAAIVVTFNRKDLLVKCLDALCRQSRPLNMIIVLDNASTDSTHEAVAPFLEMTEIKFIYERSATNMGGAGGFARGLELALLNGADWAWMMDDDAMADKLALASLDVNSLDPGNVYASTPVCGEVLSWPMTPVPSPAGKRKSVALHINELQPRTEVLNLPFLGFLIHRRLVQSAGLPDASLFISADDTEYSLRLKKMGARMIVIRASRIDHPAAVIGYRRFLWKRLPFISLAPWRRYYDTRNRLLIARRYHGMEIWTKTLPGVFARMWFIAVFERNRLLQLKAAAAGVLDGLRDIRGRRHEHWHLDK